MANDIQKFVETVVEQAGLSGLPEDFQQEYIEKMTIEAQKRLGVTAMSELSNEKIEEFSKLAEANRDNPEMLNDFLKENIENYDEKMAKALQEFGEEILESAKKLNG
jgi:hypothetical protein